MKNWKLTIVAMMSGLVLLGSAAAFGQDWPQWRGPNRDGKVTGFKAPQTWPKELKPGWKVAVGAGDSSPLLVGDKLFVFARQGDDEVTWCLNAADGKEAWAHDKNAVPVIGGPAARAHAGPRATPAIADGKIVTVGVTGIISCLDTATGKVLWRKEDYKGAPKFYTASSPLITEGVVIAQLGGDDGAIVAFNLADGKVKWECKNQAPAYASPILATAEGVKQVVTMTDKNVVSVDLAKGSLLWQIAFEAKGMAYNAATPIADGATVIYSGQGRGAKAVKIEKKEDAQATKEVWSNPTGTKFSSPVLKDGLLYAVSDKGNLFCVNAKDGAAAWTDTAKLGDYGAMLDVGEAIFALPSNSQLIVFKPGDKEYAELAKYKVAETPTFAYPIVAGKRIFVKDQESLILWTLE